LMPINGLVFIILQAKDTAKLCKIRENSRQLAHP
jgi:hypothetical protein